MTNKPISKSNPMLNGTNIPNPSNQREKSKSLESMDIYLEAIENLKKEVSNLTANFDKGDIDHKIPIIVLETIPLGDLEFLVDNLRQKMTELVNFVNLEEKELNILKECESKLSAKLAKANKTDKLSLETQLADSQEARKLLEKTLVGQRRNLKKHQEILNQHIKILNRRKGIFDLKSFDTISLDPLLNSSPQTDLLKEREAIFAQVGLKEQENEVEAQKQQLDFHPLQKTPLLRPNKQLKQDKQWPKWAIPALIMGLLVMAGSIFYSLKLTSLLWEKPSLELVNKTPKLKAVAAVGYIEPKGGAIKLSASTSFEGVRVEQLLVKQGDLVKAGQAIAILDNRDRLQASLEQAQNQVELASAKLEQIKAGAKPGEVKAQDAEFQRIQAELAGQIASQKAIINELEVRLKGEQQSQKATIRRIKAELDYAERECEQHQILFENGAVSEAKLKQICLQQETNTENLKEAEVHLEQTVSSLQAQIAEAKANLERITSTLKQQVNAERANLEAIEEVPLVDIQVAEAELKGAKSAVKKAEAELKLAYVRAPKDGQILKIHTLPGELVNSEGIVDLGQTDQMYVRAEVYETDISKVKIGQKAIVKSDGIVGDLQGTVEEIGLEIGKRDILDTDPVADADARVVEVKIKLSPEANDKVASLTNLQVNVIIDTLSI